MRLGIVLACASCAVFSPEVVAAGTCETPPAQTAACEEALDEATALITQTLAVLDGTDDLNSAERAAAALRAFHAGSPVLTEKIARFLPPGNAAQTEVFLRPPTPAWERYNAARQRVCRALMHYGELFRRENYYGSVALRAAMEPFFRPLPRNPDGSWDGNALFEGGSTRATPPPSAPAAPK